MARILITGGKGALGRWFTERLASDDVLAPRWPGPHEISSPGHAELDVTLRHPCGERIAAFRPDIVLNCAAFTGVDAAEVRKVEAYRANRDGAGYAAEAARKAGARFVHFSTDYVFPGTRSDPYTEEDPPHPLNAYGASKLAGELKVMTLCPENVILRTSWLYGPYGANFVRSIVSLAKTQPQLQVVNDQWGCPTYIPHLAEAALHLLRADSRGIYNFCDDGVITWHEFALAIVAGAGLKTPVHAVPTAEVPRPAARPAYSALATKKIRAAGVAVRPWQEGLADLFRRVKEGKADPV